MGEVDYDSQTRTSLPNDRIEIQGRCPGDVVTYDLRQKTRSGEAIYPKVKRVYVAGKVRGWRFGTFAKRSGRRVRGVKVNYEQSRAGYSRRGDTGSRGASRHRVAATRVAAGTSRFTKIVEVPKGARNVRFAGSRLPRRYQDALQSVR